MALCDDYSLPVDFVNKQRAVGELGLWRTAVEPSIELLDTYCDPRDSKAYLVPGEDATAKVYTSPDREYTHPYAGEYEYRFSVNTRIDISGHKYLVGRDLSVFSF